ncbi:MAG: MCE family protein [Chitinophagaceae bacterium]|nr:MCE family protein [Chitinophagaceae bacterium]
MKINNETKVGILTVVALGLLIAGFNFLKGKDIFDNKTKIYAVFGQVGDLTKSNEVKINGYTIGTVYEMKEVDKNLSAIRVTISLTRDVNIPANSVAHIKSSFGGLSAATIVIEKGNATSFLQDGDSLHTREDEGLLGGLASEVSPTLSRVRNTLDTLNLLLSNVNHLFDTDAKKNLQGTIANLNGATHSLNRMLDADNGALAKTLSNVNSITGNLKNNNDSINEIISNTKQFTRSLSGIQIQPTMDTLQAAISQMKSAINKISSNEGTLGALINDKTLYNKLNDAVLSAEILMDDLRVHPKRYVNISIFGKKDKGGALTSPAIKDTVPR